LTAEALAAGLPAIHRSPRDEGRLEGIVIRPVSNARLSLDSCALSAAGGVEGDYWAKGCWKTLDDGRPHPDVQVSLINIHAVELLAAGRERCPLAGDNLLVDFDLSRDSLRTGQRLAIGSSVIEITEQLHTGCGKFAERFGRDALAFVNSELGMALRLRGVYAKVITDGVVRVGDAVCRV
jgi:hypothetical protein